MSIKTEVIEVTPEMAGEWMDRHWERIANKKFKQRPLSISRVMRYAQAMKDGHWRLSPEPIVIDVNGDITNGQHRLEAVRKAGVTVMMTVTTGWDPDTIEVMDQGITRSNAQLLALNSNYGGYASRYSGAAGAVARIAYRGHTAALTFANCQYLLEKANLKANIDAIMAKSPNHLKDFQPSVVGPLAYYHTVRPQKATQFADSLFNFETVKGSPVNLYMTWIRSGRYQAAEPGKRGHLYTRKVAGLCACIRAWDENDKITRVVAVNTAIEWLGDLNPKLRDWVRAHVTQRHDKALAKKLKE